MSLDVTLYLLVHQKKIKGFEVPRGSSKNPSEDTSVFANGITEKYPNCRLCYADFATDYVSVKTTDVVEDDEIENYTTPVSNPNEEELSEEKILVLKNGL